MTDDERTNENLSRRDMLMGTAMAVVVAGCADGGGGGPGADTGTDALDDPTTTPEVTDTDTTTTPTTTTNPYEPDTSYDDGQLVYRRNDQGDASGNPNQPTNEGQDYHGMIIKASAMYQTGGHMSEMETTIGPKTIIAPHIHTNAHQLVHVLGVVDMAYDFDEEGGATSSYVVDMNPNQPGGVPVLQFQFDIDTDNPSEIIEVPVGAFVHKPANRAHSFWNNTGKRIAYMEISTGVDFEIFTRGSVDIETMDELEELEEESHTYFGELEVLARLMVENGIFNIKGMGGLNDAISNVKEELAQLIQQIAMDEGINLPFNPFTDLVIDTD